MDASRKIQDGIHWLSLDHESMCPEIRVHIICGGCYVSDMFSFGKRDMQGGSIFTAALRDILACGQCDMFVCDERYRGLSFRICYEKPRSINASRFLQSFPVHDLFHPQEGSEGSGDPVGHLPKAKATRTSQPKRAVSALQARTATIEVAEQATTAVIDAGIITF